MKGDILEEYKLIENDSRVYFNGSIWKSNNYGKLTIVGKFNTSSVEKTYYFLCKFEDGTLIRTSQAAIKEGKVKNPNYPSVCGVGYIGQGIWLPKCNGKETQEYSVWKAMITRCYSENFHIKNPNYKNVIVCERWHCFQNFCEDILLLDGYNRWKDGTEYELDKDTLCEKMNIVPKTYSSKTCIFISKKDNLSESTSRNNLTGLIYVGISPDGKEHEFTNQNDFALEYNLTRGSVSACINKRRKQHKGWTFKVKE